MDRVAASEKGGREAMSGSVGLYRDDCHQRTARLLILWSVQSFRFDPAETPGFDPMETAKD